MAVAVRTQQAQILKTMVIANPVDVVQVHREPLAAPLGDPACFTLIYEQAGLEKARFQVISANPASNQLADWSAARAGFHFPATSGFVPCLRGKPEPFAAFAICMTFVVIPLHLGPIVHAAAIVQGTWPVDCAEPHAEFPAPDRFHPGRMAEAEMPLAFGETMAVVVEFLDRCPVVHPLHGLIIVEQVFECVAGMLPGGN